MSGYGSNLPLIRTYAQIWRHILISETVKTRRKEFGLTQAEVAALAGVSPRYVFDVENGKPTIALDRLLLVLEALGLELRIEIANVER